MTIDAVELSRLATIAGSLFVAGIVLFGLRRALARTTLAGADRRAVWLEVAVPFTLWLAAVWVVSVQGALFRPVPSIIPNVPTLALAIVIPVIVGLVLLARSTRVRALLAATPAPWLIGAQVYRVMGAIFLINWAHGALPGDFALPAGYGDIAVGLLALPVALWVSSRSASGRTAGILWNVLGLADLTIAVSMGAMTSPGPIHFFALDHPNVLIATFPTVLIPAFAVPVSFILHVLSLWQLRRVGRAVPIVAVDTRAVGAVTH